MPRILLIATCVFLMSVYLSACKKEQDEYDIRQELRSNCRQGVSLTRKVLLIGLDGCRTDALLAAHTPAIDSLMSHAYVSLHNDVGTSTVSVPGWSTILHGVWANKHGLTTNNFDTPNYASYPDVFAYARMANPALNLASLTNWSDFLRISSEEDYAQYMNTDVEVKNGAMVLLSNCTPDVLLLHFDDIDAAGHNFGFSPSDTNYIKSIERNDAYIGEIMQRIYQREIDYQEEWLVIVATDHGGIGTSHGNKAEIDEVRYTFLVARLPNLVRHDLAHSANTAVLPTMLHHLNVSIDSTWNLDGVPLF